MFYKKIKKQAAAVFIAASCAITTIPIEAQSSVQTVFYEDFSQYANYSKVFAYGEDIGVENTLEIDEYKNFTYSYGIGQALSINSEKRIPFEEKARFYFDSSAASMGANCFSITEFDLYIEKNASGRYEIFLSSTKDVGNHFAMLKIDGKKASVTFYKDVVSETELEDGAWHHFSVVMRITDENANAKAVLSNVNIDGKSVYTGDSELARESYKTKSKYYDMIRIVNRTDIPLGYIDNIKVKRVNTDNPLQYIDDAAALLKAARKSEGLLERYSFMQGSYSYDCLKSAYGEAIKAVESGSSSEQEEYVVLLDTLCMNITENTEAYSLTDLTHSDTRTISSLSVNNATPSEKNGAIILAFYENEVIRNQRLLNNITLSKGETQIPLTEAASYGEEITDIVVYFWESMETLVPLREKINIADYIVRSDIDIIFNDIHYHTDADAVLMADGTVFVPAENVLNLLGATLNKKADTYLAERMNGEYLEFAVGEKINGKAPYLLENGTVMIDIKDVVNAFDASYTLDKEKAVLTITSSYEENLEQSISAYFYEFSADYIGNESILFTITPPSTFGGTVEEAYIRINEKHKANIFQSETDYGRSSGWNMPMESVLLWKKAYSLTKSDSSYTGSFAGIRSNAKIYDVMFKLKTKNSGIKYVIKEKAVTIPTSSPELESVKYNAANLLLKSTFENISYYKETAEAAEAKVYYKKSSESDYKEGYSPVYEANLGQYTGTVANLEPNTSYDIKIVLDGVEEIASISTWNENPVCKEISLSDLYSGSGTLVLEGLKGTGDSWIKITGNIDVNAPDSFEAVYISDCEYLILDGVTVKGGSKYAVHVTGNSKDVRINNCDISGWGRKGVWSDDTHTYRMDMDTINYDGGVFVADARNVVIERCYIHDSAARTNSWHTDEYTQVHPAGSAAIFAHTQEGLVVRYNDLIGNTISRWNDGIEGAHNSSYKAGVGFDADIYGNMFFGGNDDAMELDGGSMNVRAFRNRIEQFYCGISIAPIKIGPVYLYDNLIYNLGDSYENSLYPIKQGDSSVSIGKQFLFGNTIIAKQNSRALSHTTAINNIFISDSSVYPISIARGGDYNFYYGKSSKYTYAENDIYLKLPQFNDYLNGDFSLKASSPATGSGKMLNSFTSAQNPDMGAYRENAFLPLRPTTMSADKYHVEMTNKGEMTVAFTVGSKEDGLDFSIEKSVCEQWLTLSGDLKGKAENGKTYTITLSADMDRMKADKNIKGDRFSCAVLFRLSNGYSIPVTVSCNR